MSVFRKYDKIHRLGKDEVEGILEGTCHIMEKIDGANLSIWKDDGKIHVGSRNNDVTEKGFNGATEYVFGHVGIQELLDAHPEYHLYGEWLVRHTIDYKATSYKKFYMFDILTPDGYMLPTEVVEIAEKYGIPFAPLLATIDNPTMEQINEFMGKSQFGDKGEGVVIKNMSYRNPFGDLVYGKLVSEEFKENNGITFGGNNKFSDSYWEIYIMNKYITLARVKKVMDKVQPMVNERLDMKHIPRILQTTYHDMITEEAWEIANKVGTVDFKVLQRVCSKKIRQVYVDILNDSISIADLNK